MRSELWNWGVQAVYDTQPDVLSPKSCLPDQLVEAALQQGVRQRFTLGEMEAIHNGFRIFSAAHQHFESMEVGNYGYEWPLRGEKTISIQKEPYIVQDSTSLGIHDYPSRTITFSAVLWGTGERREAGYGPGIDDYQNIDSSSQYRTWLVVHEFAHIFLQDLLSTVNPEKNITQIQERHRNNLPNDWRGSYPASVGIPTDYARRNNQEAFIEAITGVIWNKGYTAIPGFEENGGGRTGSSNSTSNPRNVSTIFSTNDENLETWILENIIGMNAEIMDF